MKSHEQDWRIRDVTAGEKFGIAQKPFLVLDRLGVLIKVVISHQS
jgi:hypothetical protein